MSEKCPVAISNKTCRSKGVVGKNAIVPKFVQTFSQKDFKILDFGCGKEMIHVKNLLSLGFDVVGYEFGENVTDSHLKVLPKNYFDIVYASNVFNTHSNALMSAEALHLIKKTLKDQGHLIFNLSKSPNYFWHNQADFLKLVNEIFAWNPIKVDKRGIFAVRKDRYSEEYLLTTA